MTRPVVVIGLDAADPLLVEHWTDEGRLPVLARLRASGSYMRLIDFPYCRAEAACTSFLTGCPPWKTGRWTPFVFRPDYTVEECQAYEFDDYPPFYALGAGRRVAMFDLPQTRISDGVHGIQVIGWGAHSPRCTRESRPDGLLTDLTARHGVHPTYEKDHAATWDRRAMEALARGLDVGIERRGAICRELLQREKWDLFLTYFGELHAAGHFFWHLSQPDHPLHGMGSWGRDPLLDVFQAVDRAVGEIVAASPADACFVLFSNHGMEANSSDLASLVFLPELLYRWSFPGKLGLEAASSHGAVPAPVWPRASREWTHEVWARKQDPNPLTRALRRRLPAEFFHYAIERRLGLNGVPLCPEDCALGYQPPMWYRPAWPRMKAFALPSFSEGYIRINLRGRERDGIVEANDYERVCDEIEALLRQTRDARAGQPMVAEIMRPRRSPLDCDPNLPDADLLVRWTGRPVDTVDTPFGRIGPMPFNRTGGHVERGFLLAIGPGVPAGTRMGTAHALDLPPTILALVGAPIPAYMEGRPLWASDERAA